MAQYTCALRLSVTGLARCRFPFPPTPWAVRVETPARDSVPDTGEFERHFSSAVRPALSV